MNIRILRIASNIILRILGIAFITSAVSNSWRLLNIPDLNKAIDTYRLFLILAAEIKFTLGIWLLSGLFKKATWLSALLYFAFLSLITLYKCITGVKFCICLGSIHLSPFFALCGIYLPIVIVLFLFRPRGLKLFTLPESMPCFYGTVCFWLITTLITTLALVQNESVKLSSSNEALKEIKNICISRYTPGKPEPTQKV